MQTLTKILLILLLAQSAFSAELLVYKGPNWMDDLTQEQLAEYVKKWPNFMERYHARNRPGDVIDIKPNGFWDNRGHGKEKFYVLRYPDMTMAEARKLTDPIFDDSNGVLLKKRRYFVDTEKVTFDPITEKLTVTSLKDAELYDKTNDKKLTVLRVSWWTRLWDYLI